MSGTETPPPRVFFGKRKLTDIPFLVLFLLGGLIHFAFTFVYIGTSNGYYPVLHELDPENCLQQWCFLSNLGCEMGRVKIISSNALSANQSCMNPCVDDYLFVDDAGLCMKQSQLDLTLVEQCHAQNQLAGRRLEEATPRIFTSIVADTAGILVGLFAFIFAVAILWAFLMKRYTRCMVWFTLLLQVFGLGLMAFWSLEELESSALTAILLTACTLMAVMILSNKSRIKTAVELLHEACQGLKAHVSVFGTYFCLPSRKNTS